MQRRLKQALIAADIADALDLKSEAEALRGEASNLAEKGDAMGSGDLNAVAENSRQLKRSLRLSCKSLRR